MSSTKSVYTVEHIPPEPRIVEVRNNDSNSFTVFFSSCFAILLIFLVGIFFSLKDQISTLKLDVISLSKEVSVLKAFKKDLESAIEESANSKADSDDQGVTESKRIEPD